MRKFCEDCGSLLSEGTQFCGKCGAPAGDTRSPNVTGTPATSVPMPLAAESQTPPGFSTTGSAAMVSEPAPAVSSSVMPTNVASALSYFAGLITGIIFLVLDPYKNNSVVRFHAYQSIFFNVAWFAFWIVWMIVSAILTPLSAGLFGLIALPLILILSLVGFCLWAFLMYQAYQQTLFRLPIVGKFAAQYAGVRL
jgi:uncharacterized membrane protein